MYILYICSSFDEISNCCIVYENAVGVEDKFKFSDKSLWNMTKP